MFLPPQVATIRWIDATTSELRLEDGRGLSGSVLKAVGGARIVVDSARRRVFAPICALWNSGLYRSVYPELGDEVMIMNAVNRLGFLSATQCHISSARPWISGA
jgi:hypothetical protein